MPNITDPVTGKDFKPNLLLSMKNITRGFGGSAQGEMAAVTNMFEFIEAFRIRDMDKFRKPLVLLFEDQKNKKKKVEPKLSNGVVVVVNGKELSFNDTTGHRMTVRATYGNMHVLQLRHIAALKHHFPSTSFVSLTVPSGEVQAGYAQARGEEKLLAMMMQNMPSSVRNAIISSNMCITVKCSVCNRILVITCDCPRSEPPSIEFQTRYSLVVMLSVFSDVAMMNSSDSHPYRARVLHPDIMTALSPA